MTIPDAPPFDPGLQIFVWYPIETYTHSEHDDEDGVMICDNSASNPTTGLARLIEDRWVSYDFKWGVEIYYFSPTHWAPRPVEPKPIPSPKGR